MADGLGLVSIDLEAKIAKFESDLGRAQRVLQKELRQMEREAEKRAQAMRQSFANVFAGAFATAAAVVSIDAVTDAIKDAINEADKLNDMRIRFDIDAASLFDLKLIAGQTGTDLDTLGKGVKKLSKEMVAAADGGKAQKAMFDSLGVSVLDADGKLKGVTAILPEIADKFAAMNDPIREAALAQELLGKSGTEMLETLNLGGQGMREMADRAKELRGGLDEIQLQKIMEDADAFNDHLGEMQYAVQVLMMRIGSELLPVIDDWIDAVIEWVTNAENVEMVTNLVSDAMQALGDLLSGVGDTLQTLNSLLPDTSGSMDGLGSSTKDVTGVFGGLGSAVAFVNSLLGIVSNTIAGVVNDLTGLTSAATAALNFVIGSADAARDYMNRARGWRAMAAQNSANIGDIFNDKYFKPLQEAADKKAAQDRLIASDPRFASFNQAGRTATDKFTGGGGGGGGKPKPAPRRSGGGGINKAAQDLKRAQDEIAKDILEWTRELAVNGLEPFEKAYAKSMDEIADKTKEFAAAGVKPEKIKEWSKAMNDAAKSRRDWARTEKISEVVGQTVSNLQDEVEALGLSNRQLEIRNNLKKVEELNAKGHFETVAKYEDAVKRVTEATGKAFDAKAIKAAAEQAVNQWLNVWERGLNELGNIISGAFNGQIRSFKDLLGGFKSLLSNFLGDVAGTVWRQKVTEPTMGWIKSIMSGEGDAKMPGWIGGLKKVFENGAKGIGSAISKVFPRLGNAVGGMSSATFAAAGPIAAIAAAMFGSANFYQKGWRAEGQRGDIIKSSLGMAMPSMLTDKLLTSLGVSGKIASLLSLSGLWTRAFGRKAPEVQGQGIMGSLGFDGFTGSAFSDMIAKGGWFRSDKKWTDTSALQTPVQQAFDGVSRRLSGAAKDLAKSLGVDLAAALSSVRVDLGKITLDADPEKAKEQIKAELERMAEVLAGEAVKAAGFGKLLDATFNASEVFAALQSAIQLTTGGAEVLGRAMNDLEREFAVRGVDYFKRLANENGTGLVDEVKRVTEVLGQYGSMISGIDSELKSSGLSDYQKSILQIELQYRNQIKQANALAKSLGLSGARTEDLTKIEMLRAVQMAQLQKQMTDTRDKFLHDLRMGEMSTLRDDEKLSLAQAAYDTALQGKDLDAAQSALTDLLEVGKRLFASGTDYKSLFDSQVSRLEGMTFEDTTLSDLADILIALPDEIARALFAKAVDGGTFTAPVTPADSADTTGLDVATAEISVQTSETNALLRQILAESRASNKQSQADSLREQLIA